MRENKAVSAALFKLVLSMTIFGTIGVFVRHIPLPSSVIAFARGLIGMLFLLLVMRLTGRKLSRAAIRANLSRLLFCGAALGMNWILLFEAYRYTTVATATLCYYLAPMIVMLVSPVLLKERLTGRKAACIAAALVGMVFVSGVAQSGLPKAQELRGILFGLGAACLYASVILLNKGLRGIDAYDKTAAQLGVAAAVMAPYILLTQDVTALSVSPTALGLLAFVAVVHTGVAYWLYFGCMKDLRAQTVAIFSYIDPVVAILLSAFFLGEPMTAGGALGAAMILGSALASELPQKEK